MYHRAKPYYIHERIAKLGSMFSLRVLLVMNDVHDSMTDIRDLSKVALSHDLTIVMAWNEEQAATYIETYKLFEHKSPDPIRERTQSDYAGQVNTMLTSIRGVNKTDALTLTSNLGSIDSISRASVDQVSHLPGFGQVKVKRLREAFNQPFRVGEVRTMRQRKAHEALAAAERGEALPDDWNARARADVSAPSTRPDDTPAQDSPVKGSSSELLPPSGSMRGGEENVRPPGIVESTSTAPSPVTDPSRDPTPAPDNPSLRAALAFRRKGKTAQFPGKAFNPPILPAETSTKSTSKHPAEPTNAPPSPRGSKRLRSHLLTDEHASIDSPALPLEGAGADVDENGGQRDEDREGLDLDLELRDMEDMDDSAQMALALQLSGTELPNTDAERRGAVHNQDQGAQTDQTRAKPNGHHPRSATDATAEPARAEFTSQPADDIELELDDLDELTEEQQLALALQMSQQGQ